MTVPTLAVRRAANPLRLLLVTGAGTIPNWLVKCLHDVERSGAVEVVLVWPVGAEPRPRSPGFLRRLTRGLFWLHETVDRRLFHRLPDALAPVALEVALPQRPSLENPASGTTALADQRIDLILDPFCLLPHGSLAAHASYGVWSVAFGRSGDARTQTSPSFWEVIEGAPGIEARLCLERQGLEGKRPFHVLMAPTDRRSVWRSQNLICWKLAGALATTLRRLCEDPSAFFARLPAAPSFDSARRASTAPGNAAMLRAGAALVRRYVADKWRDAYYREQWALAYQRGPDSALRLTAPRAWIPPMDRHWADPFPVRVGDEHYVFHEELRTATGKGCIVVTVLRDDGSAAEWAIPVLDADYHLSYPCVFQWDGDFFMVPESASSHQVQLYRCVQFPTQWKLERVLLSGVRAFDATPALISGRWWLFASVAAHGVESGSGSMDELHLFHADSPVGPWIAHRNNPVKSDVRSGRPAGRVFEHQGAVYRPAQDCSKHYGHAISINRILQLDPETFEEVEVERITSQWPLVKGVHTFNRVGSMTIIDCVVRRRRPFPTRRTAPHHGNGRPESGTPLSDGLRSP